MRIAITGGAGFIGSNLCRRLASVGHAVTILDDLSTGFAANLEQVGASLTVGSITDQEEVARWAVGADHLVHLAAHGSVPRSVLQPIETNEVNVRGTLNVLEAARQHAIPVIVASSSSVYGANTTIPKHEELLPQPSSPYAVSKLATEAYALAWGRTYGLPTLAFRFFNVYGPGQRAGHVYAAVIPAFLDAALRGEPVEVHGDGEQSRDFTFVDTVCDAIAYAIDTGLSCSSPVNLALGTRFTLNELLQTIETSLGHAIERNHVSRRVGDVDHSQASPARLHELIPRLAPVPLPTGIQRTIDWMRDDLSLSFRQ